MKRNGIILILLGLLSLLLFGCGGSGGNPGETTKAKGETQTTEAKVSDTYEDDEVAISNIRAVHLPNTDENDVAVIYTIKNKGNDSMALQLAYGSLYQNGVECQPFAGSWGSEWRDYFEKNNLRDTSTSLMDGGEITVYEVFKVDNLDTPFLARIKKGFEDPVLIAEKEINPSDIENVEVETTEATTEEQQSQEETTEKKEEAKEIKIGDKIKTDDYTITVKDIDFSYEIDPPNTDSYYNCYEAPSGKVYIDVKCKVKNKMKRDILLSETLTAGAVYDNDYNYSGLTVLEDDSYFRTAGNWVVAEPLSSGIVHCIIECPKEVEESDKPVKVLLHPKNSPVEEYSYKLR